MANYLKIYYEETEDYTAQPDNYEYRNKPFAISPVFETNIDSFYNLSHGDDVKRTYALEFILKDTKFDFLPGDVIGILPENDKEEVVELLIRLGLDNVMHKKYNIEILKDTNKKNPVIPKHLPQSSTLHNIFLRYVDIRSIPKKLFLKSLIPFTKDKEEQERLVAICSPAGSKDYAKLLEENRSLLSLLKSFSSCQPPVELLLENSAPLNPRYFSISSSPLTNKLSIIFNVLELGNDLKGVCTSWLERTIKNESSKTRLVPFYFKKPGSFRLNNINQHLILVATGTGLAPFMGFLQHKKLLSLSSCTSPQTETLLFYGCRYSTKDFLMEKQLKSYLEDGVLTKLYTVFSREGEKKEYVQNKIFEHKDEVTDLIFNKEALVFICGDAKTVLKDVKEVFVKCFMSCKNIDASSAEEILKSLVTSERFLVDSWL